MNGTLELSDETRARLGELRELSEKAEAGDKGARRELRRRLRSSSPEVIGQASDFGRGAGRVLARTAAAGDVLTEEALFVKLDRMRLEIGGAAPTPLERLLVERIVSLWMLTALLEVLIGAQYQPAREGWKQSSPSYIIQQSRILESASRRYLAAIRELARVRKLQANTPGVQFNTQINVR